LVVPAAARVLGVQIHLYDLKPAVRGKFAAPKQVIKHIYPDPLPMPAPAQTINILRINQGHFGLLTPVAAAAAAPAGAGGPGRAPTPPQAAPPPRAATPPRSVTPPAARRKPVVAPNSRATAKNVVGNTAKALANMRLANKAAPATGPATRSRTRATAKRNVSRSPASNSSFEKEMRRAIEASKRVNMIAKGAENAAKKAEIVAKKAEADAKKEAARAKIAAKRAANAVKKAAKKAANNAQRQEAENLQEAIAASLKNMPSSFL
jgi:histone H1/5